MGGVSPSAHFHLAGEHWAVGLLRYTATLLGILSLCCYTVREQWGNTLAEQWAVDLMLHTATQRLSSEQLEALYT